MLTLTKQQPAPNEFLQGKQDVSTGSRDSPVTSPRMTKMTEAGIIRLPKMTDPSIARIPKCARCRNHGIDCELKGHKEKCKFKNCSCRSCLVVVERQKVTATRVAHLRHQRKLAVKRGSDTPDYRNRNPLTEEEELILSRHLQNKSTDDAEYKRYNQTKSNDKYEHYSDVIPPFSNTKACMLLREAQNAYSYFYGKCYYLDEKEDRYDGQALPAVSRVKHHEGKYYRDRDNHSPTYGKTFKTVCIRDSDDHAADKYSKCTSRSIIAPRVMRLDENQYYSDYFKSSKRDYYYEQKLALQNNISPPVGKYERIHANISGGTNRLIEPLKVNNTLEKEILQNREESHNSNKRLEVLVIMFPEIKEERLKEVLRQHNSDIQSTVQFLLKITNSPSDANAMQSCRGTTYAPSHNNTAAGDGYSQSSHSEHGIHNLIDEQKPCKKAGAQDAQEMSAFTAVRRKCAR